MAKKEIRGLLITNQISEDGGTTWKTIVCETDSTVTGTSAISTKKTKCGPFTSTSLDATKVTGNGVAMGGTAFTTEMSYARLQQLRDWQTPITFRRQNLAGNGNLTGEVSYCMFQGYVSDVSETSNEADVTTFTWSVISTGTVDWNYAS